MRMDRVLVNMQHEARAAQTQPSHCRTQLVVQLANANLKSRFLIRLLYTIFVVNFSRSRIDCRACAQEIRV